MKIIQICSAWHPRDKRWYHAKIDKIDLDKQECKVSWVGYPEEDLLKAMYVKVLPVPDIKQFQIGVTCEAINPQDGKWQGVIIEKIVDKGYLVKFRKSENKEVVF